jgi:hypothetical protein
MVALLILLRRRQLTADITRLSIALKPGAAKKAPHLVSTNKSKRVT